jgi:membrane protein implicated in regulation of membrane protease activity
MDSPAEMRKRYQRFFAWAFVLATILALGLFWAELAFPPAPVPAVAPAAAAAGTVNPNDFDLHDLQLLVAVAALVAALVSFAGLVIATPLAWLEVRRERTRAAIESALKRQDGIDGRIAARSADLRDGEGFRMRSTGHGRLTRRQAETRGSPLGEATAVNSLGKSRATP